MWIDTHCHLDAPEFNGEETVVASQAQEQGVGMIVVPSVARFDFETVRLLAHQHGNCAYALGIHPMYVARSVEEDLQVLREMVQQNLSDPRFVGLGEIGLDFFVKEISEGAPRARQEHFYVEQLKIAREFDLPVILHVRRSQDMLLKYLRRIKVRGGIAHAFNGSFQQAQAFIDMGFKLGFGGAMTYPRALQIRRLAEQLPLDTIVLETDAPDISPAWLHPQHNTPDQIPKIGAVLAQLRQLPVEEIAVQTSANARAALTRLAHI